jgi:putative membrane protein
MKKLFSNVVSATAGLWLATLFVPEVVVRLDPQSSFFGLPLTATWQIFLILGIILGLLNYFVKPILKALALPLQIITLGLFNIVINMGLLWMLDSMFDELYVLWFWPLFDTTLIIWILNFIISKILIKHE